MIKQALFRRWIGFAIPTTLVFAMVVLFYSIQYKSTGAKVSDVFGRGCIVLGLPMLVTCLCMGIRRSVFAAIYCSICFSFLSIVFFIIVFLFFPSIEWWISGHYTVKHISEKFETSITLSLFLSPFFSFYAMLMSSDDDLTMQIEKEWIGKVFFKLLGKPIAIFITVSGIILSALQVFIKLADKSNPMLDQNILQSLGVF